MMIFSRAGPLPPLRVFSDMHTLNAGQMLEQTARLIAALTARDWHYAHSDKGVERQTLGGAALVPTSP